MVAGTVVGARSRPRVPAPAVPISAQETIWARVTAAAADVSPILRPTTLPAALTHAYLKNAVPGAYGVEYAGGSLRLFVGAGAFNPPLLSSDGRQETVTVRGREGVLQLESAAGPSLRLWLWWKEPGRWVSGQTGNARDYVFYLVSADGMSPSEVIRFVEALGPA